MHTKKNTTVESGSVEPKSHQGDIGLKHDSGKPSISLIPRKAIELEAQVMMFGAKKYAKNNWRQGIAYSRLIDAGLRHLLAYADGEDLDPETGISHLAHARCCLGMLIDMPASWDDRKDGYPETVGGVS